MEGLAFAVPTQDALGALAITPAKSAGGALLRAAGVAAAAGMAVSVIPDQTPSIDDRACPLAATRSVPRDGRGAPTAVAPLRMRLPGRRTV